MNVVKNKTRRLILAIAAVLAAGAAWIVIAEFGGQAAVDRAYVLCLSGGMAETEIDVMYEAISRAEGSRDQLIEKFSQVYIGKPADPAYVACITALVDAASEQR